jgi:hypothetical protein
MFCAVLLATSLTAAATVGFSQANCTVGAASSVQPATPVPIAYLASVIPTPGVQSSNGGTSAVRNAADSSLTATMGSGEG